MLCRIRCISFKEVKVNLQMINQRQQTENKLCKFCKSALNSYFSIVTKVRTECFDLTFSHAEAAEDYGDEEGDGDDDDGDGDVPQEEDEGRDSGGYYEDEEAEGEPYESQPTSDSGHSMPDFTADVDVHKSDMMPEEETKPEPEPEEKVERKQGEQFL